MRIQDTAKSVMAARLRAHRGVGFGRRPFLVYCVALAEGRALMSDKELFERIAARVLAMAQDSFPAPVTLRPAKLLEEEEIELDKHSLVLCQHTLRWLHEEGFFRSGGYAIVVNDNLAHHVYPEAQLTAKGLSALNATIDFAGKRGRAGEILVNQMKEAAKDTRSAAVSEIVGRIIGVAAKSFLGD